MKKDEFMGAVHASFNRLGPLSNPSASQPLYNGLINLFSMLYDIATTQKGGDTNTEALTGLLDNIKLKFDIETRGLKKQIESLEASVKKLETANAASKATSKGAGRV